MSWWLTLIGVVLGGALVARVLRGQKSGGGKKKSKLLPFTRTIELIEAPLPGGHHTRDFRSAATKAAADAVSLELRAAAIATTTTATATATATPITEAKEAPAPPALAKTASGAAIHVVNWNVERGFRLPEIIADLKALTPPPDVILLQEVDIDCVRSGRVDVAAEIASALHMQLVFVTDMLRVNTENENDPNAPKSHNPRDFKDNYGVLGAPGEGAEGNAILTRFNFARVYPLVTPCVRNRAMPYHAHRKKHTTAVASIESTIGLITCYSTHLDAFAGRVARVTQFQVLAEDAKQHALPIIAGDLNTHNHGVSRLVDRQCAGDPYRWKAWGLTEAEWWRSKVFGSQWHDPYDHVRDVTTSIQMRGYTVWRGKIDFVLYRPWLLRSRHHVVSRTGASDHQFLSLLLEPNHTA